MRYLLAILALIVLAGCAPAFEPAAGGAPGVTLSAEQGDGFTTYHLEADPAVNRVFLRFVGSGLETTEEDCETVADALECIITAEAGLTSLSLPVSGEVTNHPDLPYGVVCREECFAVWLSG